ncbi:MAG: chemotaxis protein CheD [Armatimonadetes bacterium]|nr:chemotaxis protein CheD [Armatimonadota bacterium]
MKTTNVGLAESRISRNPTEVLTAMGLGSCVALVLYDPSSRTGALAHVMLPRGSASDDKPAKFAETAVPFLVEELGKAGIEPASLRAAVFGGATLLATGQSALLEIGARNVGAVEGALAKAGLVTVISDVGGTKGRTVQLKIATGDVTVKVLGQPDRVFDELAVSAEVQR